MSQIYDETYAAAEELVGISGIKEGNLCVVGCSTSEVSGKRIGSSGTVEVAQEIVKALLDVFNKKGIHLAAQCCEHLNRALVIERSEAEKRGYEIVCAVPHPHAGGSFATTVYHTFEDPVLVREIKADAGIDIGNTLIGMHLKRVAVPVRLEHNRIGSAQVNAARTRPEYIGGERAKYE